LIDFCTNLIIFIKKIFNINIKLYIINTSRCIHGNSRRIESPMEEVISCFAKRIILQSQNSRRIILN